jgi:hypothetical protein
MVRATDAHARRGGTHAGWPACSAARHIEQTGLPGSRIWISVAIAAMASGCGSPRPPTNVTHDLHPSIVGRRVQLVVDACIKLDSLSAADDHFLVAESMMVGRNTADDVQTYLVRKTVLVAPRPVVLACAASHSATPTPHRIAARQGSPVSLGTQPFQVDVGTVPSADQVSWWGQLATFAQGAAFTAAQGKRLSIFSSGPAPVRVEGVTHSESLREHLDADSVLYLGLNGRLESEGKGNVKSAAMTAASVALAVVSARAQSGAQGTVLTPGGRVTSTPGVGFFSVYRPMRGLELSQAAATLVDLKSGEISWTYAMFDSDLRANNAIGTLLFDLTHRRGPDD